MTCPICLRGVFTTKASGIVLQYVRDEEGLKLLANGERDLAFMGEDKLAEMSLDGSLSSVNIVDSVPLDCTMVLAGPDSEVTPMQIRRGQTMTVATSYPFLLDQVSAGDCVDLRPRYVSGGCEGYVTSGLCDLSFDIKSSGKTIAMNGLKVYSETQKLRLNVLNACEYDPRSGGDKLFEGMKKVMQTLTERWEQADNLELDSYTLKLVRSPNEQVKKMFSEFGELIQALQRPERDRSEIVAEAADLLYALQVSLARDGISFIDVLEEDVRRNQLSETWVQP